MLQITIPETEWYDEVKEEFVITKQQNLKLEHSLVSISKWESKWKKPFISEKTKSIAETIDYVRCMTISQNVDPDIYRALTAENIEAVNAYVEDPMTATWFNTTKNKNKSRKSSNKQIVTSELIYAWMIELNIPFECQKWHLNRLMTLIRVCDERRTPPKKMGRNEIAQRNRALNEARRKRLNTTG